MTTARDIIALALKEAGVLGVGQTALDEDMNDGYTYLRRMIATWNKKRYLVPALQDVAKVATGAKSYTVGIGGNINLAFRPNQIKGAYFIQLNTGPTPVSLPLAQVFAYEDYIRITLKDLHTFPNVYFYDNAVPLGNVFVHPIPDANYELHFLFQTLLDFPNTANGLDSVFTLADEYEEAIHYNLAIRLCSAYQTEPQKSTIALAKAGRRMLKTSNIQIASLGMPAALTSNKAFNIYNPDAS